MHPVPDVTEMNGWKDREMDEYDEELGRWGGEKGKTDTVESEIWMDRPSIDVSQV